MLKLKTDLIIILGVLALGMLAGLETTRSKKERHLSRFWNLSLSLFDDFLAFATIRGTYIMPLQVKMFF